MSKRIILSYGDDEYLPIFADIGHNLKEKNMFLYESKEIIDNSIYSIILNEIKYNAPHPGQALLGAAVSSQFLAKLKKCICV